MYLNNFKFVNTQVARFFDSMQEVDYEVRYWPGEKIAHVDALSRAPVDVVGPTLDEVLADRYTVCVVVSEKERVAVCQAADVDLKQVKSRTKDLYRDINGMCWKICWYL